MRLAVLAAAAFLARAATEIDLVRRGVSGFIDDAFYYLLIARHFAQQGIATFDGVNPTNGFHPLWMLLLAAMEMVLGPGTPALRELAAMKATELAVGAAALAACLVAFARLRAATPLAWGFMAMAVVLLVPGWSFFREGMETPLAATFLALALLAVVERRAGLLAVALPLLFLARLDTLVFAIAPLAAAWWLQGERRWQPFVPLVAVVAAYLAFNLATTGSATPISGQIKSSFPAITAHWSFLRDPIDAVPEAGWMSLVTAASLLQACVAVVAAAGLVAWHRRAAWAPVAAVALAIAALLVANQLLFQRWDKGVDPRYLAFPYLLAAFALGTVVATRVPRAMPWLAGSALVACAVAWGSEMHRRAAERIDRTSHFQVMAMTRPGERFAGTDIGAFAFWLERPFVNLDGLVNNRRLQDAIRDRRFADYLREMDVRYLALAFWDAPQSHVTRPTDRMYRSRIFPEGVRGPAYDHYDFTVYSYIHGVDSDPVRLCPSQEIFRAGIGRDGTANAAIVIYKLATPCAR